MPAGMSLLPKLNSAWRVPLILTATVVLASISVLASLVDGSGRLQHGCARAWGRFIFWVSRVRVKIRGLERIDPARGYVFMANHLSMFDHWAFLAHIPAQFRFAAKASLFRIPFLGWHLQRAGNIPVDRYHPRRAIRHFQAFGKQIQAGVSVVVYPEGERTFGDAMSPFKRGPFLLARSARAPIVPVTLIGAHRRLERGSFIIYPGEMEMIIHPPIEYASYRDEDLRQVARQVRQVIASAYRQVPR